MCWQCAYLLFRKLPRFHVDTYTRTHVCWQCAYPLFRKLPRFHVDTCTRTHVCWQCAYLLCPVCRVICVSSYSAREIVDFHYVFGRLFEFGLFLLCCACVCMRSLATRLARMWISKMFSGALLNFLLLCVCMCMYMCMWWVVLYCVCVCVCVCMCRFVLRCVVLYCVCVYVYIIA